MSKFLKAVGRGLPVILGMIFIVAGAARADFRKNDTLRTLSGVTLDQPPAAPSAAETPTSLVQELPHQKLSGMARTASSMGARVQSYLQTLPALLAGGKTPPSLRLDYVHVVPGIQGAADAAYVRFVQTHQGLDVEGSQVVVTLRMGAGSGQVDGVNAQWYPAIQTRVNAGTMNAAQATSHARLKLGAYGSPAVVRALGERVRWLRGQWRVVHEFHIDNLGLRAAVDEASGQTELWDGRYYQTYSGNVSGRVVLFNPQATSTLDTALLKELTVTDGAGASTFTDLTGKFTLTTPSTINIPVTLSGQWSKVVDQNQSPLSTVIAAGAPNPVNLMFNPTGNTETNTAQTNGYYHANFIHDWIVSKGIDVPGIDIAIPVNVNIADTCNAYYDGSSINFFKNGSGCINTAYDTVVYHEYGHFIDDSIGGIPSSGLSEGWGDIMASYATGQSVIGEGFYAGQPGSQIRNANNTYHYQAVDEPHNQGQAWMGFAWDLRQGLIASLGQSAGVALAEHLVLHTLFANSLDIPSAVIAVAQLDSPDGKVDDGPHFAQIMAAAKNHGLDFAFDTVPPSAPTALAVSAPTQQSLTVTWTAAADNIAVAGYRIDVSADPSFATLLQAYNNADVGNVTQTVISGLNPLSTYYVRLRAYDQAYNTSPNSLPASGTTLEGDTTPPTIAITAPSSGASLSGTVTMSGTAGDNRGVTSIILGSEGLTLATLSGSASWSYSLDSTVLANGPHSLTAKALDAAGNSSAASVAVTVFNAGQAAYSPLLSVPVCAAADSVCDSGGLLNSRGFLVGAEEPHQPNTLYNSCPEGFAGAYHADESNDRIKITSLDGQPFTAGKPVKIEATVWAFNGYSADALDLYYTASVASPSWVYLTTLLPTAPGAQVLSATYTLPNGSLQAVRASFRYGGFPSPCTTGTFDDHDDLAFAVNGGTEPVPGTRFVTSISSLGTPRNNHPGWVGMRVQVGAAPLLVSSLGRIYVPGTFHQAHEVKFVVASTGQDVPGGSVVIPPVGDPNQFSYASLPAPIALAANTLYYLVSHEFSGGDFWYDYDNTVLNTTADGSIPGMVWSADSSPVNWNAYNVPNHSYVPVDFRYQPLSPSPVASLTLNGKVYADSSNPLVVKVGDAVSYAWSSLGADTASSTLEFVGTDTCGDTSGQPWAANTLNGAIMNYVIPACNAGSSGATYTLTYKVAVSSTGLTAIAKAYIHVDPAAGGASALFIKTDEATQGSWKGIYGIEGYSLHGDAQVLPGYAQLNVANYSDFTWADPTADIRGLQKAGSNERLASCWYDAATFTIDVNLIDDQTHAVSLYVTDWDNYFGRVERLDVTNAATGTVLDSRMVSNFQGGRYYVWNVKGHVKIIVTNLNSNAVVSGIFFGPPANGLSNFGEPNTTTLGAFPTVVRVYPNPFKASRGDQTIAFDHMPAGSTVKIFTVSARSVKTLHATADAAVWDLTNDSGDKVASGIYLYVISDGQGNKTRGKFSIIK